MIPDSVRRENEAHFGTGLVTKNPPESDFPHARRCQVTEASATAQLAMLRRPLQTLRGTGSSSDPKCTAIFAAGLPGPREVAPVGDPDV